MRARLAGVGGVPYKGLILDFVGVLTEGVAQAHAEWCAAQGLAPRAWGETLTNHPEARAHYRALEVGAMSQAEFNRRTAEVLGLDDGENLMGRVWAGVRPAMGMIALAEAARSAGYVVAMLSNSFGLDPYDPYAHIGVWELFDVAVISERERVAKPDPVIYQRVLERMGLSADECVFADDRRENLAPAASLGMRTVPVTSPDDAVVVLSEILGVGRV
ncbi:haloacid dehalogenase [Streptomyces sp. NRRL F-4489]|uniref:HAD family hydrolase n=1 Tax=Streptomyces sp. NRRL F-4489 TaxID=1609095 RepID=UPI00074AEF21|nr:HAD family phosphatase [Streptomyces sp. NRRL F-4489]KUL43841.1 haloacid dehalogenase [Streptomyces sp. NRRL F-4489]